MMTSAIVIALVVQDPVALRAAAAETAPRQATLWQGDWLEVRGEHQGFIQVYDHRRERPGYVREDQVRLYPLDAISAPAMRTLMEFFRDSPGSETLGIGYAAALIRVAPPDEINADVFDALGTMADRLAHRASAATAGSKDAATSGHLEVAQSYGVKLRSVEREGRSRVCYDGEAFRRVLALGGTGLQRARAALALTDDACVDPSASPADKQTMNAWRRDVLARVDTAGLPAYVANHLHLRRASVEANLAYELSRRGDAAGAARASEESIKALARVQRAELTEDEQPLYSDAAIRVGASRWASMAEVPTQGIGVVEKDGGQTCIQLGESVPSERCTYGRVWAASARKSARGNAIAVAVQLAESWTELWLFHREKDGWQMDVLSPAAAEPELGYVEFAGWSPDGRRALVVREARAKGQLKRAFQVVRVDTLAVETTAPRPSLVPAFQHWKTPDWLGRTVAVR